MVILDREFIDSITEFRDNYGVFMGLARTSTCRHLTKREMTAYKALQKWFYAFTGRRGAKTKKLLRLCKSIVDIGS
jgi:hypothetical protein